MPLQKCLIANRGEIAVRIIRACKELDIQAVAVYSEADAHALHVQMADEAYLIGPESAAQSYLNTEKLLEVGRQAGCDCVHPGYGFLSESAEFAQAVMDAGLTWIGPTPQTIRKMGVKTEARALMQAANVPLVPGFQSDTASDADFITAAQQIGYPVMVKAAGGGGGKGIRVVHDPAELPDALGSARREAQNAFGDPRLFLEKYIASGRHIEVQIIADTHGNVCHLYERECSTQRRHQKIIEETPSPLLDSATRERICAAAVKAAQAVDYINAGTVEFIATEDGQFYFLEMNTRLQVEHPVTEMVTGVDLVMTQFRVAMGDPLPFTQAEIRQQGHAIECRLYAEDPRSGFLPATGTVQQFIPASGPGVRVDTGLQSGDAITIHYDPMVAKLIVHARTRADAIRRMGLALGDTVVLGTTTNLEFLQAVIHSADFAGGRIDTTTIDTQLEHFITAMPAPDESDLHAALIAAALSETTSTSGPSGVQNPEADAYSPWLRADGFRMS